MTRPLAQLPHNKLALLILLCAIILGATFLLNRSQFYSTPHASEIAPVGHLSELPPVW
jgi:hypothetical protein